MYALKIINIKRGKIRKTIRWAEKIGNNWYMIPRLSNIPDNKSEGTFVTNFTKVGGVEEVGLSRYNAGGNFLGGVVICASYEVINHPVA